MYVFTALKECPPVHTVPCTVDGGPRITIPASIKEIFFLFFTSTIMDLIVVETNRYATTCIGDSWEPITPEELCAYFGFMMLMGLVKLPSIYDYWQKDLVYHYSPIADRISWKRFFDIHRFIHFANNATLSAPGSSDYDKLGKIRPILTSLTDRFSAIYEPGKDLSIDEAMIPYKGRSS